MSNTHESSRTLDVNEVLDAARDTNTALVKAWAEVSKVSAEPLREAFRVAGKEMRFEMGYQLIEHCINRSVSIQQRIEKFQNNGAATFLTQSLTLELDSLVDEQQDMVTRLESLKEDRKLFTNGADGKFTEVGSSKRKKSIAN